MENEIGVSAGVVEVDEKALAEQAGRLALARALSKSHGDGIEGIKKSCESAARAACEGIIALARGFGPEFGKTFEADSIRVELAFNDLDAGKVKGCASVSKKSYVQQSSFACLAREAPEAAQAAAMRALMERNSWLSDGVDADSLEYYATSQSDEGYRHLKGFYERLPSLGAVGLEFQAMLATEAKWSHPRWLAQAYLEDMLRDGAESGLLPKSFARSKLIIYRGEPGEETRLVRFGIKHLASFSSGETDMLPGYPQKPFGDEIEWRLPSLENGHGALWEAMCEKIATAMALGWPGGQEFLGQEFQGSSRSAVERELLEVEASAAPKRKAKSI